MSYGATESPGNIRYQIGCSISLIRRNVEEDDWEGVVNQTRLLVTLAAPYIKEEDVEKYSVDASDLLELGDEEYLAAIEARTMRVLREVLRRLQEVGLYAWQEVGEAGDATGIALGRDDEEAVMA